MIKYLKLLILKLDDERLESILISLVSIYLKSNQSVIKLLKHLIKNRSFHLK